MGGQYKMIHIERQCKHIPIENKYKKGGSSSALLLCDSDIIPIKSQYKRNSNETQYTLIPSESLYARIQIGILYTKDSD
eukprot:8753178-Pyramimonas_sp.AAC.1